MSATRTAVTAELNGVELIAVYDATDALLEAPTVWDVWDGNVGDYLGTNLTLEAAVELYSNAADTAFAGRLRLVPEQASA